MIKITQRTMDIFRMYYPRTLPLDRQLLLRLGLFKSIPASNSWVQDNGGYFEENYSGITAMAPDGTTLSIPRGIAFKVLDGVRRSKRALTWHDNDAEAIADLENIYKHEVHLLPHMPTEIPDDPFYVTGSN